MKSLNKVLLIGNVGSDPRVIDVQSGVMAVFRLATNRTSGGKQVTDWHNILCFDKVADIVSKYVRKGTRIYIEGSIRNKHWKSTGGVEMKDNEIVVDNILLLDSKGANPAPGDPIRPEPAKESVGGDDFEDEIPF